MWELQHLQSIVTCASCASDALRFFHLYSRCFYLESLVAVLCALIIGRYFCRAI